MVDRRTVQVQTETRGAVPEGAVDFHLFTERSTGEDSVFYRTADGYRLALARLPNGQLGPVDPSITVRKMPAPRLSVTEAAARLIYHRYDGNYGLRGDLPSPAWSGSGTWVASSLLAAGISVPSPFRPSGSIAVQLPLSARRHLQCARRRRL